MNTFSCTLGKLTAQHVSFAIYSISDNKSSAPASGYKSSTPAATASLSASVGASSAQGSLFALAGVDQVVFPTTRGKAPHILRSGCERLKHNRTK